MGAVLTFQQTTRRRGRKPAEQKAGEIVIFPGVRIERHQLDLSHRVKRTAGRTSFDSLDGGRPRKSS
jgi:hypothetical protein